MGVYVKKKSLLFIEPSLSLRFFMQQIKTKGYQNLIISSQEDYLHLPQDNLIGSSAFFHIDTRDEEAVLVLVQQLAEKFKIEGVIPGYGIYGVLAAKIADYLKTPGLKPEIARRLYGKDMLQKSLKELNITLPISYQVDTKQELEKVAQHITFPWILKSIHRTLSLKSKKVYTIDEANLAFETIIKNSIENQYLKNGILVEQYIEGPEYNIEGLINNGVFHLLSLNEKLFLSEQSFPERGHIVRSDIDPICSKKIACYFQKIISGLKLDYGSFFSKIRFSEKGFVLLNFKMNIANNIFSNLINCANKNDYYKNIFELFSGQPITFPRTTKSNAGILFFYQKDGKKKNFKSYLKMLSKKPLVLEMREYCKEDIDFEELSTGIQKIGHVILVHQDYEILKHHIKKIIKSSEF